MVGSGKMGVALSVRLWLHDLLFPEVLLCARPRLDKMTFTFFLAMSIPCLPTGAPENSAPGTTLKGFWSHVFPSGVFLVPCCQHLDSLLDCC